NMAVGVMGSDLLVRVAPDTTDELLGKPGVRLFSMGGRTMQGWVMVDGGAIATKPTLTSWVRRGVDYAGSLPAK
ncbi:MAG: RNA methyltransferase, partial [Mycobacteriales bacterium]